MVLGVAPAPSAQTDGLSSAVAQFYPSSLDADLAAIVAGNSDVRRQCHAVLQADGRGDAAIVLAAYTNSQSAVVRVLARGTSGFAVADEAAGTQLAGSSCEVDRADVDGDGTPEAVVRFSVQQGTRDWVYAWRDGALADLSPLTAEGEPIAVFNTYLVDLDGDGVLELRSRPRRANASDPTPPESTFRLRAGSYVLVRY